MIVRNAAQLLTITDSDLGIIPDGAVVIEGGKIAWVGPSSGIPRSAFPTQDFADATGCVVMPGFVDCHTHLVFGGWREDEFEQRLEGKTYKEIAEAGGGILDTVRKTRAAAQADLYDAGRKRLQEMLAWGTTTCEIKSGYGLDTETELKMLRVIKRLAADSEMTVAPTFLGAHSVPPEHAKAEYIELLVNEMIPKVAELKLAQFCDVFCESFAFNAGESKRILEAGKKHGLRPKIHADEIEASGGAEVAAEVGAVSAEHLLVSSDRGLRAMKEKGVVAVLLPGTAFFLKGKRDSPVPRMRELGMTIALGSDFNPGSCTAFAMPLIVSLACLVYGITIKEALIGATLNAAKALKLEDRKGSLSPGKDADILILDIPNYKHIPYRLGHNPVKTVIRNGKTVLR
jgi:imidazolonepropionase